MHLSVAVWLGEVCRLVDEAWDIKACLSHSIIGSGPFRVEIAVKLGCKTGRGSAARVEHAQVT